MSTIPDMPEPVPPEPIITRDRISKEDIAKINKALEASQGDRKMAAEILGITMNRLVSAITNMPALNARWKTSGELLAGEVNVNETTTVNRAPPKPLALTQSEKLAVELVVNEKKLNRSLTKLGFSAQEVTAISNVEDFAGKHFQETLSIMHGGLLKSAMRLMLLAERIEKTYLQEEDLDERERKWWWDQYFRILEKLRDMNEQTNKAALTKAMIEMKKKETNVMTKPKFTVHPVNAIQINAPNATINTDPSAAPRT